MVEVLGDPQDLRRFFDTLASVRERVTLVVGAGLASQAGAPSSAELVRALCVSADRPIPSGDLFDVADLLARERSEGWVQEQVARVIAEAELLPTPVLMALGKCGSRLILTTNYDLAIEVSAQAAGLPVETLTLTETAVAMQASSAVLRVLHIHGVTSRPETIVLTSASYAVAGKDERLATVTRWAAVQNVLLFVGHSLAPKEGHLRRDIRWARELLDEAKTLVDRRHLLLTGVQDPTDPAVPAEAEDLLVGAGVHRVVFADPRGEHAYTSAAAYVVAGPAVADLADRLSAVPDERIDRHYVPMVVARAEEVATENARGRFLARTFAGRAMSATDLDDLERRMLLVAGGGHGKTQELYRIGRRSTLPAMYKTISSVDPGVRGQQADAVFVSWMTDALGFAPVTPRLTVERLREHAFVFLLDGLDGPSRRSRRAACWP
jgi:hypothetical protein